MQIFKMSGIRVRPLKLKCSKTNLPLIYKSKNYCHNCRASSRRSLGYIKRCETWNFRTWISSKSRNERKASGIRRPSLIFMSRVEAYGSSFVCYAEGGVTDYAEGGATEAYCNRAVCPSVCLLQAFLVAR